LEFNNLMIHIPVLKKEVLSFLKPEPNENFIDATIGEGGHTLAILEKNGPEGKVLGLDQDLKQIENCELSLKTRFKERIVLVCDNFTNLKNIVKQQKFGPVSGILLDLGMSSWHLEKSERGFSFRKQESLDMRYKAQNYLTADKIVNEYSQKEIEQILKEYGEERFAKKISQEIVKTRKAIPIKKTSQLVQIIKKVVPIWYQHRKIHFATKTFQALRIAVNDELNNLIKVLPQTIEILKPGGRIVVISFHSLEDRIVKNFLKQEAQKQVLQINTKKPIRADNEEIKINARSRSAKLRAAIKI